MYRLLYIFALHMKVNAILFLYFLYILLGFLFNPKRFNVSMTRAQALLIVVGCPSVLVHDENWSKLLWYCVDNGAYTGAPLPTRVSCEDDTSSVSGIIDAMERMALGEYDQEEEEEDGFVLIHD